jgi:hypothetical protein
MRTTVHTRKSRSVRTLLAVLAVLVVSAGLVDSAAAQLVNPGFDSGPTGPVGNFGTVVGPPFQAGFWGAEAADIVAATPCFGPRTGPYLLQMNNSFDVLSQAWQAVDVSTGPPVNVTLSAWGNTCPGGAGTLVELTIRTFNSANGWPSHTYIITGGATALDGDPNTWQKVSLQCVTIPADTKWIIAELDVVNSTSGGNPTAIDDVKLDFNPCPVPTRPTTWGSVKALYKSP